MPRHIHEDNRIAGVEHIGTPYSLTAGTTREQIEDILADLNEVTQLSGGGPHTHPDTAITAEAHSGSPNSLDAGTVRDQVGDLLTLVNGAGGGYTDEQAQDAVGGILVDSSTVDFTYVDGTPSITASVIPGGIDHGALAGLGDFADHAASAIGASQVAAIPYSLTGSSVSDQLGELLTIANFTNVNRHFCGVYAKPTGTTPGYVGGAQTNTAVGTAASSPQVTGAYFQYTTGTTTGNCGGWSSSAAQVRTGWAPVVFHAKFRTGTSIADYRFWCGMFSATPMASATPAVHMVGLRYESGTDTNWRAVTAAGSTPTTADTGVAVAVSTDYEVIITVNADAAKFYINGTLVATIATTLPTTTTNLTLWVQCCTKTTAAKIAQVSRMVVEFR